MRIQTVPPFVHKQRVWLHMLLVVGIFVYLYSPLLDHWSGKVVTRPHTHIHIAEGFAADLAHHLEGDVTESSHESDEQADAVLCLLDLTTQLSILLHLDLLLVEQSMDKVSLVFDLVPAYLWVSPIHLSSLDPPPRI